MPELSKYPGKTLVIFSPLLHHDQNMKFFGGIHPWVINYANGLSALGYRVTLIVSTRQTGQLSISGLDSNILIHKIGFYGLSALWDLYKYYRKHPPQITITAGHRYNRLIERVSRFVSCGKWVVSIHENLTKSIASMTPSKIQKRIKEVRDYSRADGLIAVSEGLKIDMVENFQFAAEHVKVIYNPLVKPEIMELASLPVEHPWFQDGVDNVMLGMGRLEDQKNWPLLINAFSKFVTKHDARLVILGEGKNRDDLQKQINQLGLEDKVQLPGFVSNPYSYYARAKCLVLTSDWEGFGNVLVEAMSVGTPVVSTNCPSGPSEILENGKWGELVPPGNEAHLVRSLEKTWLNPLEHDALISRAQDFTVEKQVLELDSYLREIT